MDEGQSGGRKIVVVVLAIVLMLGGGAWWAGKGKNQQVELFMPVKERIVGRITPTIQKDNVSKIIRELQDLVATQSGTYAVWVESLDGQRKYGFNEKVVMEGASILKVPAMITILKEIEAGRLSATDTAKLEEADRANGSGPLQYLPAGTKLTWQRILEEMGKKSDNTGWRLVNRIVGRVEIQKTVDEMGMRDTNYSEEVYTTTATDVAKMFAHLPKSIYEYLQDTVYEDRIPKGVVGDVEIVHKVGTLPGVWSDAGIVINKHPFVVVILNKGVKQFEATEMVPEIMRRIWQFESERK